MRSSLFRSVGEFNAYASEVFDLFAELPVDSTKASSSDGCCSSSRFCDRTAAREAFFVLFGYHPSRSLLEVLGDTCDSPILEEDFLRFVHSCAAQEEGMIADVRPNVTRGFQANRAVLEDMTIHTLFHALSKGKESITREDLYAADSSSSLTGASELVGSAVSVTATRRQRILSHVFDVLDIDKDGKLQLSDVKDLFLVSGEREQ